MRSISTKFILAFAIVGLLFSAAILAQAYVMIVRYQEVAASDQAALALEFDLAIRDYIATHVRPEMENRVSPEEFYPETMSTSFVARHVFERVNLKFPDTILKFSAINPRNPANAAGPEELEVIRYFRANLDTNDLSRKLMIDNKLYHGIFRARRFTSECLRCHGDPADAPANLVFTYGTEGGFGLSVGEVVLDTVAIPINDIYSELRREAPVQLGLLALALLLMCGSILLVFRYTVASRLARISAHFENVANHGESMRLEVIPEDGKDEIGMLAKGYNAIVLRLQNFHGALESRVQTRTEELQEEVTQRREVEESLRQREAKISSIFRAAPVGIVVVVDWVFTRVNDRFCEMLGYESDELIGQSAKLIFESEEEYSRVGKEKYGRFHKKGICTLETKFVRKDGTSIDVIVNSTPIDPDNWEAGVTFIALDITSRKSAEEKRHELETQLRKKQRIEAVGQLAGGVAHDFNNLLQALQGYMDMAMLQMDEGSESYEDLFEACKASERAQTLVKQLLAFSRQDRLQPRNLDLPQVVGELTKMLRHLIGEHIELKIQHAPDTALIFADPSQIEQVLMNLCVNARDAMPEGGSIVIETKNVDVAHGTFENGNSTLSGKCVLLSISDNGTGMPPEVVERVFEPFFTTKEVGKGTGMGLATVYGIVKQHSGTIHVDSEPGIGTTFSIYLPVSQHEGEPTPEAKKIVRTLPQGTETILLAEDEDLVRNVAIRMLSQAGYNVIVAKDGNEAVDLAQQHLSEIRLCILDVVMPGKNGRAVLEAIRKQGCKVPVLFSTGYGMDALEMQTFPHEDCELIQKPYSVHVLLNKVRSMLDDVNEG